MAYMDKWQNGQDGNKHNASDARQVLLEKHLREQQERLSHQQLRDEAHLRQRHEERQKIEDLARAERFRSGLIGMIDKLTGYHKRLEGYCAHSCGNVR